MPNWCSNTLTVSGDTQQVLDFTEQAARDQQMVAQPHATEDAPLVFSLDRFVPCPEDLSNANEGSFSTVGYQVFCADDLASQTTASLESIEPTPASILSHALTLGQTWDSVLKYPWVREAGVKTLKELQKFLREKDPRYEKEGRHRASNFKNYGYGSWYDWALANWGTKWDVVCTQMDYLDNGDNTSSVTYDFDSAWSPPEIGVAAISKLLPELTFRLHYLEEGEGFRGFTVWVDGNITEERSEAFEDEDEEEEEGELEDE